ncbi:TonB-linked SusC/RagA family outer membrane protein [Dyadobacter jejuensis]|uniref:TonB-linked SusC/RagA family outer membrane protein n=1 Tax=Dyadobacter jejuensis TaxID=1082580 RepID=A0A316AL91_9BACT|nr:TonB-dependent receptor [Dyadobacter jejuensis]PWJ58148.1 TonB-linked SusC/RagA family outer membrane protein [Dyadobacter jejuensis]
MQKKILLYRFLCKPVLFVLALLTIAGQPVSAQQAGRSISGQVMDENNEPLPGVNIQLKGTLIGASTNSNGDYKINVASDDATLIFSFIGYESQEIVVGNRSTIDVSLVADVSELKELVVVGYGSQSRETVTTSISKLDTKVFENVTFASPASALQGTISGLRVQSTSGQPGASPRVILRGGTSIDNPDGSTPLYVIDGVIRSDMDNINTADIESIQVLKDAASTSIYGARASNGVIIVETKSGKVGTTQVRYNYNLTSSKVGNTYDLAGGKDFIKFMRMGIAASGVKSPSVLDFLTQANAGGTGNDLTNNTAFTTMYLSPDNSYLLDLPADQWGAMWETTPDPLDPTKDLIFKATDFQKTVFRQAYTHDHNLNVSGGTEKVKYSMGLGYLNSQGIAINTDYKRLTLNLNGDVQVSKKLNFFGRLNYANVDDNQVPNVGVVFKNNINTAQTSKYQFEDGSLAPGRLFTNGNPAYYISRYDSERIRNNYMVVVGSKLDILPGLTFRPQLSLINNTFSTRNFLKSYLNGPLVLNENRESTTSQISQVQHQADAVLNYSKTFGNSHNLDATLGYSYFKTFNKDLTAVGRNAGTDLIPTLNASATPWSVTGSESEQLLYGYFGRLNYNFEQKYLVTVNARYDGASNLGADYKWGFFPGVSLGWNLHREAFWDMMPASISNLKLRGSYGVNGNISGLGNYQAQGSYAVGERYNGAAAIYNTDLANPALQWEKSKTLNFGFDLGLFQNRVTAAVDVYRRVTDNLLTSLALPRSTGFTSILTNLGSLENKGLDLEVSARLLPATSDVQWTAAFNASYVKMKILQLPENGIENNRIGGFNVWDEATNSYQWKGGLQEGGTIGDMYAYKQLSIYATDEEAAAGPVDMLVVGADKTKHGGDVNWQDTDGNGIIDSQDRVYMGNPYPTWTGGLTNRLNYKGFGFTVRMDYTTGHMIYNETKARVLGNFSGQNAISAAVTRSWQNQGDITDIPRYYWADQNQKSNLYRGNSNYYEKGDFLCLREISLSYMLPESIANKLKMSNVRFHATANNLKYFTKFTGLNPEEGGTDTGRFPMPRNFIFGLQLTPSF